MANVQLLKVAHAFIPGLRGEAGGAPSKDSVWGIALVQGNLVSFGGRRGGVLRYKTHKKAEREALMAKFESKLTGNPFGTKVAGVYEQLTGSAIEVMLPGFQDVIGKGFYTAMSHKKLNIQQKK